MASILEDIQLSVDNRDSEKTICLLSHIRQTRDAYAYFRSNIDFAGVLESFLFNIPDENTNTNDARQNEQQQQDIILLFLDIVDPSLVMPSLSPKHDPRSLIQHPVFQVDLTIVHNLCMEGKHEALRMLLNQVHPLIASYEVQRPVWLCVDYMDDGMNIYHSDDFCTPMHAAWNGILFERSSSSSVEMDLANVHLTSDLDEEWAKVWNTSIYLLQAFDGRTIDGTSITDSSAPADWNILHAIIRYGYRAHAALTWLGLKLYPHLATVLDHEGNLPLHLAVKQQIYYQYQKTLDGDRKCPYFNHENHKHLYSSPFSPISKDFDTNMVGMDTGDMNMDTDTGDHASLELGGMNTGMKENSHNRSPLSMILETYPLAASVFDKQGRLPLHLLLIHHEENLVLFDSIIGATATFMDGSGSHMHEHYQMDTLAIVKGMVEANPRALECVDPSCGLPPFLLAASRPRMPLDVVYTLLSENPTVLIESKKEI